MIEAWPAVERELEALAAVIADLRDARNVAAPARPYTVGPFRQAGGHSIERSTAHLEKPRTNGVFLEVYAARSLMSTR